jgi:hypothetical protein
MFGLGTDGFAAAPLTLPAIAGEHSRQVCGKCGANTRTSGCVRQ